MIKIIVSVASPNIVEVIVLKAKNFPFVTTFNFDNIIEFRKLPNKNPANEATKFLGVVPKTKLYSSEFLNVSGHGNFNTVINTKTIISYI